MKVKHISDYIKKRSEEYPPVEEQLDAIWKVLATLPSLPPEAQTLLSKIQSVKERHPKHDEKNKELL